MGSGGMLPQKICENRGLQLAINAFPAVLDHATGSEEQCNCPKHFINFLHEPAT